MIFITPSSPFYSHCLEFSNTDSHGSTLYRLLVLMLLTLLFPSQCVWAGTVQLHSGALWGGEPMSRFFDLLSTVLSPHLLQPRLSWRAGIRCCTFRLQRAPVWLCVSPGNCSTSGWHLRLKCLNIYILYIVKMWNLESFSQELGKCEVSITNYLGLCCWAVRSIQVRLRSAAIWGLPLKLSLWQDIKSLNVLL